MVLLLLSRIYPSFSLYLEQDSDHLSAWLRQWRCPSVGLRLKRLSSYLMKCTCTFCTDPCGLRRRNPTDFWIQILWPVIYDADVWDFTTVAVVNLAQAHSWWTIITLVIFHRAPSPAPKLNVRHFCLWRKILQNRRSHQPQLVSIKFSLTEPLWLALKNKRHNSYMRMVFP